MTAIDPATLPADGLDLIEDFEAYAALHWTISTKSKGIQRFSLTKAQKLIWKEFKRQMDKYGFVRLNILKCRQVGGSTFVRMMAHHYVLTHPGVTALSIAHDGALPMEWLVQCERNWAEMKPAWRPAREPAQGNLLRYDNKSVYRIGSAQGSFSGMGHTVHFMHLSEIGRWDKPPISMSPEQVLVPLKPAMPTGSDRVGTVVIRESTGVQKGDYWYRTWQDGKREDSEYVNLFLPWFLVESYRDDEHAGDIAELTDYERWLVTEAAKYGVVMDNAMLAWRRREIEAEPFFGNVELWAAEFPATEEEAFMSPGNPVFARAVLDAAKLTCRDPAWMGTLIVQGNPSSYRFETSGPKDTWIWEHPNAGYHYVIGADCRWSEKYKNEYGDTDYDVAYVQCLETMKVCARLRGKWSIGQWGKMLASLGFYYNGAVLAPERNSVAANTLMPLLRGNVADWSYPNIYVRVDDVKLAGQRAQDFGWYTDNNSKGDLIAYASEQTIGGTFDWCDARAVSEAEAWYHDKDGKPSAPAGQHDDCLMARMITGYVAHRVRPGVSLYVDPGEPRNLTGEEQRVLDHIEKIDEADRRRLGMDEDGW